MNRSPTSGGMFVAHFTDCSLAFCGMFCVYFVGERFIISTRQQFCCNEFRIHSRNVRNVFVICVLHIRRVKVWFLRCKSMVFGVQKGGFYIAKVWFLFFECCVVAIRQQHYWQAVSSCRRRFIAPAYRNTPTK